MGYITERILKKLEANDNIISEDVKAINKGFSCGFLPGSKIMVLIFETNWPVTGRNNAYVIVNGIKSASDIKKGIKYKTSFGQNWSLNFKEVLKSYGKSFKKGKYSGHGILQDNDKCRWTFTSTILKGTYTIAPESGSFSKSLSFTMMS